MSNIICIPIGKLPDGVMGELSRRLENMLQSTVVVCDGTKMLDNTYDPVRKQYDSSRILTLLARITVDPPGLILGVTHCDLFSDYCASVFGVASYAGRVAVVSGARLEDKNMFRKVRNGQFYDRLVKESLHELGHAQGLDHCIDPYCVMHKSFCVSDIDEKTLSFCSECRRQLRTVYKFTRILDPIA
jgi:archaemetzincin